MNDEWLTPTDAAELLARLTGRQLRRQRLQQLCEEGLLLHRDVEVKRQERRISRASIERYAQQGMPRQSAGGHPPHAGERFRGRDLRGISLRGALLRGQDFRGADLRNADLANAVLDGADLSGADLRGADLRGSILDKADLRGARLEGALLEGASLAGADLSE